MADRAAMRCSYTVGGLRRGPAYIPGWSVPARRLAVQALIAAQLRSILGARVGGSGTGRAERPAVDLIRAGRPAFRLVAGVWHHVPP
jgi:hypothetical protein